MTQRHSTRGPFLRDPFSSHSGTHSGDPSRGKGGIQSSRAAEAAAFFATSASGTPLIHKTALRLNCERRHSIELTGTRNEI